jgi:hypothetical protein
MAEAADPCNQALGKPLNLVFRAYCYYLAEISVIQRVVVMHRVMNSVVFAALLAGAAFVGPPTAAFAAGLDGTWSVLIITEKGECDAAYRYAVKIANGQVSYAGDASLDMAGADTTCAGRWEAEKR